jgi:hypothetical protein
VGLALDAGGGRPARRARLWPLLPVSAFFCFRFFHHHHPLSSLPLFSHAHPHSPPSTHNTIKPSTLRYLTFYSYTAQTVQFGLAAAAGLLSPSLSPPGLAASPRTRATLTRAADDAACAVFGLANVVTVMYYSLEAATAAVVEGGPVARPPWLGRAVHLANAGAAWADLLLAHPRSFSPRAATASLTLAGAYAAWLLVVRAAAGTFPYPILNALPMPWGFVGLTGTALALFAALFALGRRLSTPLLRVKAKAGWPAAGEW